MRWDEQELKITTDGKELKLEPGEKLLEVDCHEGDSGGD